MAATMQESSNKWIGWVLLILLVISALAFSMRDNRLRDGQIGSYQGRMVNDGQLPAERQREIANRVGVQRY